MVPYTIIPNADAAHWRTTFAYGEFKSWAERDDILIASVVFGCHEMIGQQIREELGDTYG